MHHSSLDCAIRRGYYPKACAHFSTLKIELGSDNLFHCPKDSGVLNETVCRDGSLYCESCHTAYLSHWPRIK